MSEQCRTGGREFDAAAIAVEQRHPEFPLEASDLHREGGLRHMQSLGGAPEMPLLGDGQEVVETAQVHDRDPLSPSIQTILDSGSLVRFPARN